VFLKRKPQPLPWFSFASPWVLTVGCLAGGMVGGCPDFSSPGSHLTLISPHLEFSLPGFLLAWISPQVTSISPHLTTPHHTTPHPTIPHQTIPHHTTPYQTEPNQTKPNQAKPNQPVVLDTPPTSQPLAIDTHLPASSSSPCHTIPYHTHPPHTTPHQTKSNQTEPNQDLPLTSYLLPPTSRLPPRL
jgi:hypothetical protein